MTEMQEFFREAGSKGGKLGGRKGGKARAKSLSPAKRKAIAKKAAAASAKVRSAKAPNITLYVKDSDLPVIEKAKKKLGESLSAVFTDCVRDRLEALKPVAPGGMKKIVLTFWNEGEQPVIQKSFKGRWLVGGPDEGLRAVDDDGGVSWDSGAEYSVAQTAKENLVVYVRHCNDGFAPLMQTFENFADMKEDGEGGYPSFPPNVIAETAAALGEPHEIELDI